MAGYIAVLVIHLHFPAAGSLKGKRKELAPVKAHLRGRLGVSVAEVEHQDIWQRATLTAAVAGRSLQGLRETTDGVERTRRPLSGGRRARRAHPGVGGRAPWLGV